jgi:hypothetical protein
MSSSFALLQSKKMDTAIFLFFFQKENYMLRRAMSKFIQDSSRPSHNGRIDLISSSKIYDLMRYLTTKSDNGNGNYGGDKEKSEANKSEMSTGKGEVREKLAPQQLLSQDTSSQKTQGMVNYAEESIHKILQDRGLLSKEQLLVSETGKSLKNEKEGSSENWNIAENKEQIRLISIKDLVDTAKKSYRYQDLLEDAFAQGEAAFQKIKMERCKEYAKENNMEVREYINKIDENARQILLGEDTKICIRCFGARYLLNIVKDEIRTMHETGMTTGGFDKYQDDLADRLAVDQIIHNQDPKKTNPSAYRVSAYVTNKKDGEGVELFSEGRLSEWYGEAITIILKDKVKERAWIGFDDTIRHIWFVGKDRKKYEVCEEGHTIEKTMKLVPFLNPNSDAFAWSMGGLREAAPEIWASKDPLKFKTLKDLPSFYTEAHIARNEAMSSGESQKPLGVEDIERVVFRGSRLGITDDQGRPDQQLLKDLMTELSERGIAWSVKKGCSLKDLFGDLTDVAKEYSKDYADAKLKLQALGSAHKEVFQYSDIHLNEIKRKFTAEELASFRKHLVKVYAKIKNKKLLEESKDLEEESKKLEEDRKGLLSILEKLRKSVEGYQ